jgi:hypothetical protein
MDSLGSDLEEEILVVNDLKKSWHKFSVILFLGHWFQLDEKMGQADKASVLHSWVLVLNSSTSGLESGIHARLHMLLASLCNQARCHITCLSDLPVLVSKALRDNWTASFKGHSLLHLAREPLDRGNTSRVDSIASTSLVVYAFSPSVHILFTLSDHLNQRREELALDQSFLPNSGWNLISKRENNFSGLRSSSFLKVLHLYDV